MRVNSSSIDSGILNRLEVLTAYNRTRLSIAIAGPPPTNRFLYRNMARLNLLLLTVYSIGFVGA